VHFLHVRSAEPNAFPLVLTHGWPGTFYEYLDVIAPLTDPRAHGGNPADAFHLIIPSMPGFPFSGPTTETGWDMARVARAWLELMRRLGYDGVAVFANYFQSVRAFAERGNTITRRGRASRSR
jgi:epoxide hydrolase